MIILAEIVLRNKNDIAQDNWISYFIVIYIVRRKIIIVIEMKKLNKIKRLSQIRGNDLNNSNIKDVI